MKYVVYFPDGVFENIVDLVGFENLCLMVSDDPQLAEDIFENVGTRLVRYFDLAVQHASVGAYERFHQRIAILGGIDVDFISRACPEEVYARSKAMLEHTTGRVVML